MKKYTLIICAIFMFFLAHNSIYAKNITVDELNTQINYELNNNEILKALLKNNARYSSNINTADGSIDIYEDSTKLIIISYQDDYITFISDNVINVDSLNDYIKRDYIIYLGIINSIIKLSGFDDKTLSEEAYNKDIYDEYGIKTSLDEYDLSGTTPYEYHYTGSIIKQLKMSLDTDKITALINEYGQNDPFAIDELIKTLEPSLKKYDVTDNSVKLIPKVNNKFSDDTVYCDIYRSKHSSRDYKKITDEPVKCMGETTFKDTDLDSDTTYYYKAVVEGGSVYSDILEVTTDEDDEESTTPDNNNSNNQDEYKNPDTGVFIPSIIVIGLTITSLIVLIYTRKKKLFVKL